MRRLTILTLALGIVPTSKALSQRPILPDFHADPSAHEWDGRYWIYPSHDLAGSQHWDMIDWHAFSSTNLVEWTDHGVIFSLEDISWADRWARSTLAASFSTTSPSTFITRSSNSPASGTSSTTCKAPLGTSVASVSTLSTTTLTAPSDP